MQANSHLILDVIHAVFAALTGWVCFSVLRFVFRRRTNERRNEKCC